VVGTRTFATGCDSTMHVLDAATGKELASCDLGQGSQVPASAAVSGNFLYVGTMGNEVLAINWQKPEVAWRFKPASRDKPFYAAVAVSGDLLVAGCRNKRVYALDRKTGKETWNFPAGADVESSPVIVGKRVIAGAKDGKLYVLDLANGTELQRLDLGGQLLASPAVGGDCLVIGLANKGIAYCFGVKK
jgi:outer membrane protein assembly factor BamB